MVSGVAVPRLVARVGAARPDRAASRLTVLVGGETVARGTDGSGAKVSARRPRVAADAPRRVPLRRVTNIKRGNDAIPE